MISILCHLYHHNLWGEISASIAKIEGEKRVYINLANNISTDAISSLIKAKFPEAKILVSPNQGKDIGGNLRLLDKWLQDGSSPEELLIFCHSKNRNNGWRIELLQPLFSNYTPYLFKINPTIGMAGHQKWLYHRNHDVNSSIYNGYCRRFGITDTSMHFIAGTMFCVRASIFENFFSRFNPTQLANELEFGDVGEPSKTHSWERLYGAIVRQAGYSIKPVEYFDTIDNSLLESFSERHYLETYSDVKAAISSNIHSSGLVHYVKHGIKEGRIFRQGKPYKSMKNKEISLL